MATFFKGLKVEDDGYKPLSVNLEPVNTNAEHLKVLQCFCQYKAGTNSLELIGAITVSVNGTDGYVKQDVLTLPDRLAGSYEMDNSASKCTGWNEILGGGTDGKVVANLSNNVLSITIGTYINSSFSSQGGAAAFDLFFTKQ